MSALLCRCASNTAHAAQVNRLERALAQSKSEMQTCLSKLHRLEKHKVEINSTQERSKGMAAFVDFGNKTEYIQFLEQELERAK